MLLLAGACAPPQAQGQAAWLAPVLYAGNGLDGTVTRLDPSSGQVIGPALPAGPAPRQIVPAPNGNLLVLSGGAVERRLTHITRVGSTHVARTVSLDPGATGARLAGAFGGAGGRAVLAYLAPEAAPPGVGSRRLTCRLALINVARGAIERTHTVCGDPDTAIDVALADDPSGSLVYAALWRPAALVGDRWQPAGGRILAVAPETGSVVGAANVQGRPFQLVLSRSPLGRGTRLYCLVSDAGTDGDSSDGGDASGAGPRRLLALDPATLVVERTFPLQYAVSEIAIAPDGRDAYTLAPPRRESLLHLDLLTGSTRLLGLLPAAGGALAAAEAHVFVAYPDGQEVWMLERRQGALMASIPVGRRPIGLALSAVP